MEALEAAAGKESSYVQEAVDTETGSSIHMFAYDEETVTEANDGSATETAVVTEDVVSNYAEQKDTVENAVETAEGTCVVGDNLNSEIKIQEYKQNGIGFRYCFLIVSKHMKMCIRDRSICLKHFIVWNSPVTARPVEADWVFIL